MAYIKTKTLPNGASASYWRVTSVDANKLKSSIEVIVHGYKDKALRQADGASLTSLVYTVPTSELDFSKDLFEQVYEYIKDKKDSRQMFKQEGETFFVDALVD